MTTRCKFTCVSITATLHQSPKRPLYEARFTAVYGDSEENKKFFEWTPNGELKVGLYKENAFEIGKDYFIDILPASVAEGAE